MVAATYHAYISVGLEARRSAAEWGLCQAQARDAAFSVA